MWVWWKEKDEVLHLQYTDLVKKFVQIFPVRVCWKIWRGFLVNPVYYVKHALSVSLTATTAAYLGNSTEDTLCKVTRLTQQEQRRITYACLFTDPQFLQLHILVHTSMVLQDLREKTFLIIHCLFMRFLSLCTNNLCVFKQEYHLYHGNCRSLKQNQLAKVTWSPALNHFLECSLPFFTQRWKRKC